MGSRIVLVHIRARLRFHAIFQTIAISVGHFWKSAELKFFDVGQAIIVGIFGAIVLC